MVIEAGHLARARSMTQGVAHVCEDRLQRLSLPVLYKFAALQVIDVVVSAALVSGRKLLFSGNDLDGALQRPRSIEGRVATIRITQVDSFLAVVVDVRPFRIGYQLPKRHLDLLRDQRVACDLDKSVVVVQIEARLPEAGVKLNDCLLEGRVHRRVSRLHFVSNLVRGHGNAGRTPGFE